MTRASYAALSLFLAAAASAVLFTGCYTQLASSGDYYGYTGHVHRPPLVASDTITRAPAREIAKANAAPVAEPKYDTIMKGDTMFIQERAPERTRADYSSNLSDPNSSGGAADAATTIINNYYGGYPDDSWYYSYWHPHAVVSISIGYPWCGPRYGYRSWYSPWYDYGYSPSWWYGYAYDPWWGWGYPGFYPPVYDAFGYAPYYGYYPGYYGGYYPHYASDGGRVVHNHRAPFGERRMVIAANVGTPPGSIAPQRVVNTQSAPSQSAVLHSASSQLVATNTISSRPIVIVRRGPEEATSGMQARAMQPAESEPAMSIPATNRNSPVHAVSPAADGSVRFAESSSSATAEETRTPVSAAQAASASHHIIIVRRSAPANVGGDARSYSAPSYGTQSGVQSRSGNGGYRLGGESRNSSGTYRGGEARSSNGGMRPSGGSSTRSSGGGGMRSSGGDVGGHVGGESRSSGGGGGRSRDK